MREPELSGDFSTIMSWADEARKLGVRANADTPSDAKMARDFGAEGIGLCRTEHMFFEKERILAVREMICADDRRGAGGRWQNCCRCSGLILSSCSRSWRVCP